MIELKLTLEEINLLLEGLSEMPFKKSYQLIAKIQKQATPQAEKDNKVETPSKT